MEKKLKIAARLMGVISIIMLIVAIIGLIAAKNGINLSFYLTVQMGTVAIFLCSLANYISVKKKYSKHT